MTYRLLKVVVQPVFVVEDAEGNLSEAVSEAVTVSAKDWPTYPVTKFKDSLGELNRAYEKLDYQIEIPQPTSTED